MATLLNQLNRLRKLERQESFFRLLNAISMRPLNASERVQFLERIMVLTSEGKITPQESNKMSKAITGDKRGA